MTPAAETTPSAVTTLVVTNDFPPRVGGIESFVRDVCTLLDDDVVVLTSMNRPGRTDRVTGADAEHDRTLPFPVVRLPGPLLPTGAVGDRAVALLQRYGCRRVLFGAAAPLSLLGPRLRAAGADRVVALSHGHETWWARVPVARTLLRRMVAGLDALGTISDWSAARIAAALPDADRARLVRIPPPVDTTVFRPADVRPGDGPARVVAAGRMVRQKGFDALLEAWALLPAGRPAELVLVGDGPARERLTRQAARTGGAGPVRFAGLLDRESLAGLMRSATLFCLPVRTVRAGLTAEGLGLVFAEASASGLPVLVGHSGGAPETVRPGVTGELVDAADPAGIAAWIGELLADPERARAMGAAGRRYAVDRFGAETVRTVLRGVLDLPAGADGTGPDAGDAPGRPGAVGPAS
ncbi:phosphatidylinositol alpha-1,6-mannosyltransferase [Friedmanniella endophytica]|uniref:Phosphatidylinositol alpha-1,6-mannosyltransferase n=1 Tax=Microlunatus kandeliicorticis TaxID=1759536 RepID=A0A7W3ISC8_9ACTN|nr:glycosyltransferase family 4 protein [Microlunatus kandeliicorticis]MBA8794344.1 phosphatidylinositol alpha-1,6-mannosyltransferase [Microlunatus kandeliicorticis]